MDSFVFEVARVAGPKCIEKVGPIIANVMGMMVRVVLGIGNEGSDAKWMPWDLVVAVTFMAVAYTPQSST